MQTIKIKIKVCSDNQFVKNKQIEYSCAFRKLYSNIDLIKESSYLNSIKDKFNLNDIELRSIVSEVNAKFNQVNTAKAKLENEIINLQNDITYIKSLTKSNKNNRKLYKLTNKLNYKSNSLSKDIVFGGKSTLTRLSFLNNDKANNISEIDNLKLEYVNNRNLPLSVLGEANQKGNRFFKFDLPNNIIIYKPNKGSKIEITLCNYSNYKQILCKLQDKINYKSISVSVRLSTEYIYLIFDDEKLNNYSLELVNRFKEVNIINQTHIDKTVKSNLIKEVYKKYYKLQEKVKLGNKLSYRYLAIDTNPDYIGCSILDKCGDKHKIVHTFNYDLSKLNTLSPKDKTNNGNKIHVNNKRKHGITHIWKDIFKVFSYYRCGYLVVEDLDIKDNNLGNTVSNRKVNNLWYRELSSNLIDKYCNRLGVIKVGINPCYSSFIGNVTNEYIDPVNASIEIGRRGMYKYNKGIFYPKFEIGTIMNAMSNLNKMRDVSIIKDCLSWVEVYRKVKETGLRYRAKLEDIDILYRVVNNLGHLLVGKVCFTNIYLPINS